jgi:hypothetical protein
MTTRTLFPTTFAPGVALLTLTTPAGATPASCHLDTFHIMPSRLAPSTSTTIRGARLVDRRAAPGRVSTRSRGTVWVN